MLFGLALTFRLASYPTFNVCLLLAFGAIFKPTATFGDAAFLLALAVLAFDDFAALAKRTLDDADDRAETALVLRTKTLEAAVFLIAAGAPLVGANVSLYLWQVSTTGNANLWYFLSLTHCFAFTILTCKALAFFMPRRPRKTKPPSSGSVKSS